MKKSLEEKLVKKYPNIFRDYGGDMRQTCMAWGFSHGDGWYDLLEDTCSEIERLSKGKGIQIVALQVKEKFGGLRFYYSMECDKYPFFSKFDHFLFKLMVNKYWQYGKLYNKIKDYRKKIYKTTMEKIDHVINQAEYNSYEICEVCSKPGETRDDGWVTTLCSPCHEQRTKEL